MWRIIIWTILGCICLVPEGKAVGKFYYFICWFALMVELVLNIV